MEKNNLLYLEDKQALIQKGIVKLLEVKDVDIRLSNLYQCRHAIDSSIHIGGASSSIIPMVSVFYGGMINLNVEHPTATDQDLFVLSKGHAVATLASIYADLGYFDKSVLKNSRSITSILNGHPGPLLPGVHVATGPMGQGMGVAQGFAIAGQRAPEFNVYAITGDGELQEGPIWESVMYAGAKRLENLCVLVDNNGGQLDAVNMLHFPHHNLPQSFESFGWRVMEVDATKYHLVHEALRKFNYEKDGRPTVIICKSTKGHGGLSDFMNNHKSTINNELLDQESKLLLDVRAKRERALCRFVNALNQGHSYSEILAVLQQHGAAMGYVFSFERGVVAGIESSEVKVITKKAADRDKQINYSSDALPKLEKGKMYAAHTVIEAAMKEFAKDVKVASVDSDLATTSGLQAGVGYVDKYRALNVGVAEANMMLIGEAFAILGFNTWISTFCPFYDWKVLRRIAVGHQERLEVIIEKEGWLSEGHGIDMCLVATAADLETQSNGATHMGNDDVMIFNEVAHVKTINVCCPQQLLAVMKWVMEGNKGLIYLRILRGASKVIYDADYTFEFGKAFSIRKVAKAKASVVTSGRGVYESLEAAHLLSLKGVEINVIDMTSIDRSKIIELYRSEIPVFIVEQNNGYLWSSIRKVLFENEVTINTENLIPINVSSGRDLHYVHSGTYKELVEHYELDALSLSESILKKLS